VPTTAGELLAQPLGDAVKQIQEVKAVVTAEYVWSRVDLCGQPMMVMLNKDSMYQTSNTSGSTAWTSGGPYGRVVGI
jgi:hypothetical protein